MWLNKFHQRKSQSLGIGKSHFNMGVSGSWEKEKDRNDNSQRECQ